MPTLVFDGTRFIFFCGFSDRHLPKANGFYWDPQRKIWYTPTPAVAARLRDYATDSAKLKFSETLITVSPWQKPLPPPPNGQKLFPHQKDAVRFALERSRCYLGLDPGLGKTAVAATVARVLKKPVVYVCPPFLARNVENEFANWAPEVELKILTDSKLSSGRDVSGLSSKNTVLVVDEAHRFKNPDAKRTAALLGKGASHGFAGLFSKLVFMSGTPMPNRPMELYPILSKLAPETIDAMSQFAFGRRYCAGHLTDFGWDFTGASNLAELARRVIHPHGPFMLRMRKELLKLPPKIEEVFVVSDEMSPRLAQLDRGIGAAYQSVDDLVRQNLAASLGKDAKDLHLATYRRLLGQEKVAATAEYVESLLNETDESILIFAYHSEVIAALSEELAAYAPLVITGKTPAGDRQAVVDQFQMSSQRLLIGNYQAMGVGFTLTKATRGIFVEFSWVPGENEQAGDRMHRIGQKGSVLIQYVVYKDSLDKAIVETLLRKRKVVAQI